MTTAPIERPAGSGENAGAGRENTTAARGQCLVRIRNLTKSYSSVVAVDDVSLEVRSGEILGLLGKNGAGKSTLIKVLAGVERAERGSITVGPATVHRGYTPQVAHELGLAFMFQELEVVPMLSVAENVALGSAVPTRLRWLVAQGRLREQVRATLARLDPGIDPQQCIDELSPAQQRLVMIARALFRRSRLLVLDEPTTSLTPDEIDHLHRIIRDLRDSGCAIVYVSHRLDEVLAITDRIVVMRDGEVTTDAETGTFSLATLVAAITGESDAEPAPAPPTEAPIAGAPLVSAHGIGNGGVVKNVDIVIREGEIVGLAGLVGSGRTEVARLLSGADRLVTGCLEVGGYRFRPRSPRAAIQRGIALLPEDRRRDGLVVDFGVRSNVTLPSLTRYCIGRLFPSRRREQAVTDGLVERLAIKAADHEMPVRRLSGGNQQKVVVGKWLAHGARLLIFDEPTQGIDVEAKRQIYQLVQELAARGTSILFISSDFSELALVSDRVLVMRDGALVGEIAGADISEKSILSRCYADAAASQLTKDAP